MATTAFDSIDVRERRRQSISLHPAFPGIVALWFAALLGAGSLVLPVVLLERIVDATGIAAVVPAAASPLGLATRGLIALASALAGALAGAAIARRVARAHGGDWAQQPDSASTARRPISINEELGGDSLFDGFAFPITQDRASPFDEPNVAGDPCNPLVMDFQPAPPRENATAPPPISPPLLGRHGAHVPAASLGELDLGQLVDRLAASIARRRASLATSASGPDGWPRRLPDSDPALAEETAQAMAAYFGKQPEVAPVAARPPGLTDETDDALHAALAMLRKMSRSA